MKYNIFFIIFLFINSSAFSQYLPNWIEMGMKKDKIVNILGKNNIIEKNDKLLISASLDNFILYQYNFDKEYGLNQYWVIGLYFDIKKIVDDFVSFYGEYNIINGNYWWFDKNCLPMNVQAISLGKKGEAINIAYFFDNFE